MVHDMAAYCPRCFRVQCRCARQNKSAGPSAEELKGQRLRKYEVIIQQFNEIVAYIASDWYTREERHSELRIY